MRYEVFTLVDITNTEARFDKNDPEWHRQQNYMTLIQTIGLRTNPIVNRKPKIVKEDLKSYDFGKKYKGKQNIWHFEFETDFSFLEQETLINDFDLIPIITSLNETVEIKEKVFQTKDNVLKNIIFKCVD